MSVYQNAHFMQNKCRERGRGLKFRGYSGFDLLHKTSFLRFSYLPASARKQISMNYDIDVNM